MKQGCTGSAQCVHGFITYINDLFDTLVDANTGIEVLGVRLEDEDIHNGVPWPSSGTGV